MSKIVRSKIRSLALVSLTFLGISCATRATQARLPYTPTPLTGTARHEAFRDYFAMLGTHIDAHWDPFNALLEYPNKVIETDELKATIWVVVDQQGDVIVSDIVSSSGTYFGREAARAVKSSGPFPSPPEGLLYRSSFGLVTSFPVLFTYRVGDSERMQQARFLAKSQKDLSAEPVEIIRTLPKAR